MFIWIGKARAPPFPMPLINEARSPRLTTPYTTNGTICLSSLGCDVRTHLSPVWRDQGNVGLFDQGLGHVCFGPAKRLSTQLQSGCYKTRWIRWSCGFMMGKRFFRFIDIKIQDTYLHFGKSVHRVSDMINSYYPRFVACCLPTFDYRHLLANDKCAIHT